MSTERAQWKSRFGFILAAAGSAIGLGNIWKFPYITGENGGGLFVLIYLACIALVGIPIMMAEIMIGRAAQKQPAGAFESLQGRKTAWSSIGWLGVASGFVILSYYVVIAGWAMDYTLKSVVNFTDGIHDTAEQQAEQFVVASDIATLRETIVEDRMAHEFREAETSMRSQLPRSVWSAFERFQATLEEADDPTEAERRLLLDEELSEQVGLAREVQAELDQQRSAMRTTIAQEVEQLSEDDVILQAEELQRRLLIFEAVSEKFGKVATDGWLSFFWAAMFMLMTILIVSTGISGGIERACKILMPTLFFMIVFMVVYAAFFQTRGFLQGVTFVFQPDPSELKASGVLEALGHAFFTLSLGMGAMITYGSYQNKKEGLLGESITIAILDTGIALLACLMIFPIIFSYGQQPDAGPGLVFKSMPLAFAEIGAGGMVLGIVFFGLLVFAALTSAISLLEVIASYFIDQRGWSRAKASWSMGLVVLLCSIPVCFAKDVRFPMHWTDSYPDNYFNTMDLLASNWMLTIGGLLISLYAGWVMPRRLQEAEVQDMPPLFFQGWLLLVRFVAPALVLVVIAQKVGILDADELFFTLFKK